MKHTGGLVLAALCLALLGTPVIASPDDAVSVSQVGAMTRSGANVSLIAQ
jgi:hypothetical protein